MPEINMAAAPATAFVAPPPSTSGDAGNMDSQSGSPPFATALQQARQTMANGDSIDIAPELAILENLSPTDALALAENAELASILPLLLAAAQASGTPIDAEMNQALTASIATGREGAVSDTPALDAILTDTGGTPIFTAALTPLQTAAVSAQATEEMPRSIPTADQSRPAIQAAVLAAMPPAGEGRQASGSTHATLPADAEADPTPGNIALATLSAKPDKPLSTDTAQREPSGNFEELLSAARETQAGMAPSTTRAAHDAIRALPVEAPVGTRAWDAEIGNRLVWMSNRQESRADLVLNPPQMGRIEVSLSVSGGEATAQFISASPAVREALENALPRLRELLADAGITLGQTHVGSESAGQSAKDRENSDNSARSLMAPLEAGGNVGVLAGLVGGTTGSWQHAGRGLVDVFA